MPTAYVLINTTLGAEKKLLEDLRKLSIVERADIVMGEYDLVAIVSCKTMAELKDTINNRIRDLDNVKSTMSLMVA
jgi:DNA-binding Lrp family transcriptional regulator